VSERFPGENLEIARQMFIWWNLGDHVVMEEGCWILRSRSTRRFHRRRERPIAATMVFASG